MNLQQAEREKVSGKSTLYEGFLLGSSGTDYVMSWIQYLH